MKRAIIRWGDFDRTRLQEDGTGSAFHTPLADIVAAVLDVGLDPRDVLVDGAVLLTDDQKDRP